MLRGLVIVLVAASLVSGCADPAPSAAAGASTPTQAAEPVVELDVGSITGVVVSEEQLPVVGARVAIIETKNQTQTDDSGRFTVNGLQPGTYQVLVEALGFETAGRKVTVNGGEVREERFVLKAVSFEAAYIDIRKFTAHILFGESFVDIGTHEVTDELCKPCHFWFLHAPNPKSSMMETDWRPPVHVAPVLNDDIFVLLCKDLENTTTKYRCSGPSGYMKNRARLNVDPSHFKGLLKSRLDVHAGVSVAYDLRVDVYVSLAYIEEAESTFTALPPPR